MAEVAFKKESSRVQNHYDEMEGYWPNLAHNDTGAWVPVSDFLNNTIQITGTLGTGGQITMEGSLDGGITAFTLTKADTTNFVLTALGGASVLEVIPLIRPNCNGGDGTTSLSVYLFGKSGRK